MRSYLVHSNIGWTDRSHLCHWLQCPRWLIYLHTDFLLCKYWLNSSKCLLWISFYSLCRVWNASLVFISFKGRKQFSSVNDLKLNSPAATYPFLSFHAFPLQCFCVLHRPVAILPRCSTLLTTKTNRPNELFAGQTLCRSTPEVHRISVLYLWYMLDRQKLSCIPNGSTYTDIFTWGSSLYLSPNSPIILVLYLLVHVVAHIWLAASQLLTSQPSA